jgi:acyl carrier protein
VVTTPTGKSAAVEAVTQELIDLIGAEVGVVDLTADSTVKVPGMDSLKFMSVVVKIEARYDILLEDGDGDGDGDGDDPRTIGDLAALVVRRIEERQ